MSDNQFFKPTVLYKEYMILDMIEKNPNITQREMSKTIGIAVSMINDHIDGYENKGLIKRKKHSTKTVEYFVTKKGIERKKVLNIGYLNDSFKMYRFAKMDIENFLNSIISRGFSNILLYGAGEVAEILLQAIIIDKEIPLKVLGLIDDDISKQNHTIFSTKIIASSCINNIQHDGILISSYTNKDMIYKKLINLKYDEGKIINFFD